MINVEIDIYEYDFKDEYWQEVDWNTVRANWPSELPEEKPKGIKDWPYAQRGLTRLTFEEVTILVSMKLPLKLRPLPGAMLTKMQDREGNWDGGITAEHLESGAAVQITIPDFTLMQISEVTYIDDACTDQVQQYLDEGWRILAVCPPNAQRRPDYIFGRSKHAAKR